MIRRHSDAETIREPCRYHESFSHEMSNYNIHTSRQNMHVEHDDSPCWCCCKDCTDLTWVHLSRKGVWWEATRDGEPPSTPETCDEPPGSAEINTF